MKSALRSRPSHGRLLCVLALAFVIPGLAPAQVERTAGIWYGSYYVKTLTYNWARDHGGGSADQFLADLDGDGTMDAVTAHDDGRWTVALSTGEGFAPPTLWIDAFGANATQRFLADLDGNGTPEAVAYDAATGAWRRYDRAAGRTLTSREGHGLGAARRFLADLDGDGALDAVAVYESGRWEAALGTGGGFAAPETWGEDFGAGATALFAEDLDGDGRAELVSFEDGGRWTVRHGRSGGISSFQAGAGSRFQVLADIDGDGLKDVVAYHETGRWDWAKLSHGPEGFAIAEVSKNWKTRHGAYARRNEVYYSETTRIFVGDVHGDGYADPVVFREGDGVWQVLPGLSHPATNAAENYYDSPFLANFWEGYNYGYEPVEGYYDSGDPAVIDRHMAEIEDAGIDFILIDNTNNLFVEKGSILERSLAVCRRLLREEHRVRFALAIGGVQFSLDPQTIEDEARHVWNLFIEREDDYEAALTPCAGRERFQMVDGKPLLAVYAEKPERAAWTLAQFPKPYADRFHIKWIQGAVCRSRRRTGCEVSGDYGGYVGWIFPDGAIPSSETMVVTPGVDNHLGTVVDRDDGAHFIDRGWRLVVCGEVAPKMVVIVSYNMYGEETAVAPTLTGALPPEKRWWDPFWYWDALKAWNASYESGARAICLE